MDLAWEAILAASTVFFLGAISPGPSLLMVIRNTIVGGRRRGLSVAELVSGLLGALRAGRFGGRSS